MKQVKGSRMVNIVLQIINSERYFSGVTKILKELKDKKIVYVTTNKPYKYILSAAKEVGISTKNLFVIDCISKPLREKTEANQENCIFLDSPEGLTAISLAISESIKLLEGDRILLLDSLSTLLIYNDANTVAKFSNFVINKLRTYDVNAIIFALESDIDKDIIKQVEALADEVKKNGLKGD